MKFCYLSSMNHYGKSRQRASESFPVPRASHGCADDVVRPAAHREDPVTTLVIVAAAAAALLLCACTVTLLRRRRRSRG